MRRSSYALARISALALGMLWVCASLFSAAATQAEEKAIASRTEDIDGVRLHYLTAGEGPAVVILLHGYAETSRMWRPIIPQLAERFRVRRSFPGRRRGWW
jgi:hypothetical protein